jgi:hypothetical protein
VPWSAFLTSGATRLARGDWVEVAFDEDGAVASLRASEELRRERP